MASAQQRKGGDELRPGEIVANHYRVIRPIAEGGMGSIFLALDGRTHQPVAIKCLYKHYKDNAIVRTRFVDEGRIQMLLQHPNIVRVYELVQRPLLAFIMEYVDGTTLEDYLQERGPLPMSEIVEIMIPILSALGLAHSRGIIHRDLKPSNILLTFQNGIVRPKVMDFGVAKLKRTQSLTATGTTVGTLHYMSPEQIVGAKNIDGRADIYSLGIILYKLCTGQVPFNASTEYSLMMAQVEARPTPPSTLNPRVNQDFELIVLKALNKRAEDRYQSIRDFTAALVEVRDEHGNETMENISVPAFILDYAIGANKIAVDRTEEVMLHAGDFVDEYDYDYSTTTLTDDARTSHDRLAADTSAATTHRLGQPGHTEDTQAEDTVDNNATMEVDLSFMKDLRSQDSSRDLPVVHRVTAAQLEPDEDPTRQAPLGISQLRELFKKIEEQDLDDPDDGDVITHVIPSLGASADSLSLTRPRPMIKAPPRQRVPPPQSNPARQSGPWSTSPPQPGFDQVPLGQSAPHSPPTAGSPSHVFGPDSVDTGERTQPKASQEDMLVRVEPELVRQLRQDYHPSYSGEFAQTQEHVSASATTSERPKYVTRSQDGVDTGLNDVAALPKPRLWMILLVLAMLAALALGAALLALSSFL